MTLLRVAARARPALRGGGGGLSEHKISMDFRTNAMQSGGWFSESPYSFWSGPTGMRPFKLYNCHGAMAPRFCSVNPITHFSCEQYWKKITPMDMVWCVIQKNWGFRIFFVGVITPLISVTIIAIINFRREPCETFIEREEYFRDFPSNYYAVYFDHHHFAHRLAVRRANKWHYTNDDLEGAHH